MNLRPLLLVLAATPQLASAVNFVWNGNNADWSTAGEWTPAGPPGGGGGNFAFVNGGVANITSNTNPIQDTFVRGTGLVNQTAGTHAVTGWNFIGDQAGNNAAYTLNTATATAGRWYAGRAGGQGTINLGPGAIMTGADGAQGLILGDGNLSRGILNVTGGSFNATAGELWVGQGAGGYGEINLSSGSVSSSNWFAVGRASATGVINLSGSGALSHTGANHTVVGSISGNGTIAQTGLTSTFTNSNDLRLGEGATGIGKYNMSAGTATVAGWTIVGWTGGGTGILDVSGSGYFNSQYVEVGGGAGGAGNGTVNLNAGGTIETKVISRNGGAISGQVNFNGGTLKAKESNADILPGFSPATSEILAGGLKVDTNGFNTAIGTGLDGVGGLTKLGNGTLTLNGVSTYSGMTIISQGTLALGAAGSLNPSSIVDVAAGATFDGSAVAGGITIPTGQTLRGNGNTVATLTTVAAGGTLAPGNSIGTLTFSGNLTLDGTTNMEIDRTGAPISDEANASGTIDYGGTLNVTLLSAPATLQLGDNFDLFDAPSFFDVFTTINLPSLSGLGDGNWYWSNNLGTAGGIQVLPEPSSALMAGLAGLGLLARRRRA